MYTPDKKILEKYADVLVNFALGGGKGIKRGDVVYVAAYEYAKPLYTEILRAITKAGGNVISHYMPNDDKEFNTTRDFYVNAKEHQISFFPSKYFKGLIDEMDHFLFVLGDTDMEALKGVPPEKIMARSRAMKQYREWRTEKENKGKLTWTLGLYGTPAMAKEAGLSEKEYWKQIIAACFLEDKNPIATWRRVERDIAVYRKKLNALKIQSVHIQGPDADLRISIGKKRKWEGGGGANIPSFEMFTSPDWRGTNGWIRFNNPVYRQGHIISGIFLEFKNGVVVKATAKKNEKFLKEMLHVPGADRIGEFSMTDKRFSRITKFMAETLYDENIGGPDGNTHIALGDSIKSAYAGNPGTVKKREWKALGFNDSVIHQDFVSTAPRTIVAMLSNGKEKVIYKNGSFSF
jgi:aminopeptidase